MGLGRGGDDDGVNGGVPDDPVCIGGDLKVTEHGLSQGESRIALVAHPDDIASVHGAKIANMVGTPLAEANDSQAQD